MKYDFYDWAWNQKTKTANEKMVLLNLAKHVDKNGSCFPSKKLISRQTLLSFSTVERCLRSLKENNIIETKARFDNSDEGSNRQTSNRYFLKAGDIAQTPPPIQLKEVPITNNYEDNKYTKEFENFWFYYPRKTSGSKFKANQSFLKCLKVISAEELTSKMMIWKKQVEKTEEKYIPHATTWLNQRRWETVNDVSENKLNSQNKNVIAG
tara:strand:+ start:222 stop:848 length:627 start_codon:yes stop_codon:yes gene_type:complete